MMIAKIFYTILFIIGGILIAIGVYIGFHPASENTIYISTVIASFLSNTMTIKELQDIMITYDEARIKLINAISMYLIMFGTFYIAGGLIGIRHYSSDASLTTEKRVEK